MDGKEIATMLEKDQRPVSPSASISVSKDRIWVDGCFDFSHHGKTLPTISASNVD